MKLRSYLVEEHLNYSPVPGLNGEQWNNVQTEISVKLLADKNPSSCPPVDQENRKAKKKKKTKSKKAKESKSGKSSNFASKQTYADTPLQNTTLKQKFVDPIYQPVSAQENPTIQDNQPVIGQERVGNEAYQPAFVNYANEFSPSVPTWNTANASDGYVEYDDSRSGPVQEQTDDNAHTFSGVPQDTSDVQEGSDIPPQAEQTYSSYTNSRQKRDVSSGSPSPSSSASSSSSSSEPPLFNTDFESLGQEFIDLPEGFADPSTSLCVPQSQDELYLKISGDLRLSFRTKFHYSQENLNTRGRNFSNQPFHFMQDECKRFG